MSIAWIKGGHLIWQILIAVAVLIVLVGPLILTKLLQSYPAHADFAPVEKTALPEDVREYLRRADATLVDKGFDAVTHMSKVTTFAPNAAKRTQQGINVFMGLMPGVQGGFNDLSQPLGATVVAFYVESQKGDMATATVEYWMRPTETGDPPLGMDVVASSVAFCTECPGGREISTDSSPAPSLPPLAEKMILWFPRVKDIEALYRIHRAAVNRYGASPKGKVPEPGREGEYLSSAMGRDLARYANMGYVFLDQESETYDVYRLTWRGACVWAWRNFWPGSMFVKARAKRKMKRILTELGESYPS